MRRVRTRVLPEPDAGEDRERSGAAGDRVALRGIETVEERVHGGTVPPGYDAHDDHPRVRHPPGQQKAPSSLRCVAARISSGPFLPTASEPLASGFPPLLGLGCGLRFPLLPGVVPFGSVTAPDRSCPSSGAPDPKVRRVRHQTGVHRFEHRKAHARDCKREFPGSRGYGPAGGRGVSRAVRGMVADALDEIPPALGAEMENVAVVVEDSPTRRNAARLARGARSSGCTRACRSPSRTVQLLGVAPIASRSSAVRCRAARATTPISRTSASPCCTRSVTTSACPTSGSRSWVGRDEETWSRHALP